MTVVQSLNLQGGNLNDTPTANRVTGKANHDNRIIAFMRPGYNLTVARHFGPYTAFFGSVNSHTYLKKGSMCRNVVRPCDY